MTGGIIVYGSPAPQGSKSFKGLSKAGHGIMVESSKAVKPWREAVKFALLGHPRISGPISVLMVFTLPKPKGASKTRVTYPDRKPDLSKLIRSTEDAITDAGCWDDDARVVRITAGKVYPNEDPCALDRPGMRLLIESVGAQ